MATGPLSIKLKCASWQQLSTIYKRDLIRGTMFLKAGTRPPIGTPVKIDLTLPSASVIVLTGVVDQHVNDPQRGTGVELKLAPIPPGSIWLIESALSSESKRRETPPAGVSVVSPAATPAPSITEGEDVAAAERDLIKALVSEAESLKRLNPFLVLGVGYEATDADVRAAFGELTKRYHPDRFARYDSTELRQVAAEIFILIRDAYRKLGDETQRAQALTTIPRTSPSPAAPRPVQPRVQAAPVAPPIPTPVKRVVTQPIGTIPRPPAAKAPAPQPALKPPHHRMATPAGGIPRITGEPPKAPPINTDRTTTASLPVLLTEASEGSPLEALLDAGRLDEAIAAYKVMAKKNPQDRSFRAGIELCEGLRALTHRDRLEAAQRFEAALEIDPSNERAARELADMRRQATNERKGLLSRLMGKKES